MSIGLLNAIIQILFLVGGFILGYFLRGIVEKDDFGKSEEKSSEKNTISK